MADWSELPRDLLGLIARKLTKISDLFQYAAVCSSWRSVAIENLCHIFRQFPKLVIPGETKNSETRRCLEPVLDDKKYFNFCESINEKSSQQLLPSSLASDYVDRAIISSDPTSSNSSRQTIVLIIYAGEEPRLAFCKLGDESWTPIESPNGDYFDAIYYKERFYAVYDRGGCDIIDIDHQTVAQYALPPPEELYSSDSCNLVESKGKLYLAVRIFRHDGGSIVMDA
ncbi:hypothetical protein FRX31_035361 [Thalictrum thalictroides]|uniref:F-box protein skip23 n=1 Tax=Thalictrum thalictroides TaxID=46969 RepID=A0A7J6UR47_THATH|nr:hypothetical protein FRX31_035361 [Thalictrum thalictroides]